MAEVTSASTLGFECDFTYDEGLTEGDFVTVAGPQGTTSYIAQITHTETNNDGVSADAAVIGEYPDLPFRVGTPVETATEQEVLEALELPDEGIELGTLTSFDTSVYLDESAFLSKQVGVFGRTGSGKSYTAGVLAEEVLENEYPLVVIDPHGEYASLKITADGSPSPYRVVEYADTTYNDEADLSLDADTPDPVDLARPGQATILNLRGIDAETSETIVDAVLTDLFDARMRGEIPATKVFLEEAHLWAPQRKNDTRKIVENIAKEGRKFGFTFTLMTQRPSEICSNVRAQLQASVVHKVTDDTDLRKVTESVEGLDTTWETQIQKLPTGRALVAGDLISSPVFVDIRERMTHHHDGRDGLFEVGSYGDSEAVQRQQQELEGDVTEQTVQHLQRQLQQLRAAASDADDNTGAEANGDETAERVTELQTRVEELETALSDREEQITQLETQLSNNESNESTDKTVPDHPYVERTITRIQDDIESLDEWERGMLDYFRHNEQGSLEDAYYYAGGSPNSGAMYTKIDGLLEKDLVVKPERGVYEYNVPTLVGTKLGEHVDEQEAAAVVQAIERVLDEQQALV